MSSREELEPYSGREQAFVKHQLLELYLERFMMILGRHCPEVLYIDCFAGPWESAAADFSDTSFGRAVRIIKGCQEALRTSQQRSVRFRALFIEQDPKAFEKLNAFASSVSTPEIRVEAWNGAFQTLVDRISDWIGDSFAFVLIDPKGYARQIEPDILAPLIRKRNVEALINFMWHFIQFAPGHADKAAHHRNLVAMFGEAYVDAPAAGDRGRADWFVNTYRNRLVQHSCPTGQFRTRTISFPVTYPGRLNAKYFLIHVTHADLGVIKFAEASEEAAAAQDSVRFIVQQQNKELRTGTADLFGALPSEDALESHGLTQPWLDLVPEVGDEVRVDETVVAKMVEQYSCFISDLQAGAGELIRAGRLQNLDMKRKRPKNVIHFSGGGERIRRLA